MEHNLIFFKMEDNPQFFLQKEGEQIFLLMEDNLNFFKWKTTYFFQIEGDPSHGRRSQLFSLNGR